MDALAAEGHFLDHLAPVWRELPVETRGTFSVDASLADRARARGVDDPRTFDVSLVRRTPQQPARRDGVPSLVASVGDVKVGRRLGAGPFAFLEHGAGQAYGRHGAAASYSGGPDRDDNELFLVPNEYSGRLWREAYPSARVEVVGSPRLDDLPARLSAANQVGSRSLPTVAISFHGDWPSGVPYGGTALHEYAPVLGQLAERFRVIGHAHPGKGWGSRVARLYARHGIEFVPEFDDVCRRADLYACDNSSTIFEFAATGRPVLLMNASYWQRGAGPGGRFWDWAHVGLNVDRPADLVDGIARALEDGADLRAGREDALSLVYARRAGAAGFAAAAIQDWLSSRVAA